MTKRDLPCGLGAQFTAVIGVLLVLVSPSPAQQAETTDAEATPPADSSQFIGPDAVPRLLERVPRAEEAALRPWDAWRAELKRDYGLDFGIDYHLVGFAATGSNGDDDSLGGVFRFFGYWEWVNRGATDAGGLVFKLEQRHSVTRVPPVEFGTEIGYAGLVQSTFSDQGYRVTNLYWKQKCLDGRVLVFAGFLDVTDYMDVYLLASPWYGFGNLVFATGSATIGSLPDGALGMMVAGWLDENFYLAAGLADLNADPTSISNGFWTLFHERETVKSLEIGWVPAHERLFLDNVHVTIWQADERDRAGVPDGWGIAFSAVHTVLDNTMLFVRAGWSDGANSPLESSISFGFGHLRRNEDLVGVGLNWGQPNRDLYGDDARDQVTAELFYRFTTPHLEITPSLQLLVHPTLNPTEDVIAVFGLRIGTKL